MAWRESHLRPVATGANPAHRGPPIAALLDALPAHVALLDGNGVIVAVNRPWRQFAAENQLADPACGVGSDYPALCAAAADCDDAVAVAAGLRAVLSGTSETFLREYPCHAPGQQRWFQLRITPLRPHPGALMIHVDITGRRQAEEHLRASEERFRALVEDAREGILLLDARGRIDYASPAAARVLGLPLEAIAGRSAIDFVHPDDAPLARQSFAAVLAHPRVPTSGTVRLRDGARWVEATGRNELAQPSVGRVVMTLRDVTERVTAETALRRRADADALLVSLSSRFITCPLDEIDDAVGEALRRVGTFTGVDRAYILRVSADGQSAEYAHEWCAPGIASLRPMMANLGSLDAFPWALERYRRGEVVLIPRVADLPPEAAPERLMSEAAGVRSSLLVPIAYGGALAGVVGYASVRGERCWDEQELGLLKVVGEMFFNALERQRGEAALRRRARHQEALASLGQLLLADPPLRAVYDAAAETAARALDTQLSVIVELLADGETLQSRAGVGWAPGLVGYTTVGSQTASHTGYTLHRGHPVVLADARSEQRFAIPPVLRAHGVVSGVAAPIGVPPQVVGCVAVYTTAPRRFDDEDLAFLRGLATALSAAIERDRARQVERYLARIVAASDDAIIGESLDGTIISWNPGAERLYGYRSGEMIGRSVRRIIPGDCQEEQQQILDRALRGQATPRLETLRRRKDGTLVDVSLTVSPIVDSNGRATGLASIARDIGAARRDAAALRSASERLQMLWEIDQAILAAAAPEAIAQAAITRLRQAVGCDRTSVLLFDEATGSMTLLAADDAGPPSLLPGDRFGLGEIGAMDVLREGHPEHIAPPGVADDGPPGLRRLAAAGFRTMVRLPMLAEGELLGTVNLLSRSADAFEPAHIEMAREVTTQIAVAMRQARLHEAVRRHADELEWRVHERTLQLEATNQELEAFAYSVSHDLRAPLRAIDGFSALLAEECGAQLDAAGRDYLGRVRTAAGRMAELIDALLDLSRVARGDLHWQVVDLSEAAAAIAAELADPRREVDFVIPPGLRVEGDRRLLRVVLQNLIGNAWKYTSKQPRARIELGRLEADGLPVHFVRDDGAGFDMAYADKLFAAFTRLHAASEFEGTGIGLATVQRIVRRHGGRVWAEGEPGRGATFYFTLGPAPPTATT